MAEDSKGNININSKTEEVKEGGIVKNMEQKGKSKGYLVYIGMIVLVGLGVLTGYFVAGRSGGGGKAGLAVTKGGKAVEISKNVYGIEDEGAFKDFAEGKLEKGGIDGEGSHKLIRPGGDDQTVYLTSSVINLDQFNGKKVKVWGETFSAQKAGWLMDVGRLELL